MIFTSSTIDTILVTIGLYSSTYLFNSYENVLISNVNYLKKYIYYT